MGRGAPGAAFTNALRFCRRFSGGAAASDFTCGADAATGAAGAASALIGAASALIGAASAFNRGFAASVLGRGARGEAHSSSESTIAQAALLPVGSVVADASRFTLQPQRRAGGELVKSITSGCSTFTPQQGPFALLAAPHGAADGKSAARAVPAAAPVGSGAVVSLVRGVCAKRGAAAALGTAGETERNRARLSDAMAYGACRRPPRCTSTCVPCARQRGVARRGRGEPAVDASPSPRAVMCQRRADAPSRARWHACTAGHRARPCPPLRQEVRSVRAQ